MEDYIYKDNLVAISNESITFFNYYYPSCKSLTVKFIEIEKIEIHVGPVDYVCNRPEPKDTEDARFSFQHIIGSILVDGDIDSHHFTNEIVSVRKKVNVNCHFDWPAEFMSGTAKIEVVLYNGNIITEERLQARGGPNAPMTDSEFKFLFQKYSKIALEPEKIDVIWEMINGIDKMDDLTDLIKLLANNIKY